MTNVRKALVAVLTLIVLVPIFSGACTKKTETLPTASPQDPPFQFFEEALRGAALTTADVGAKWEADKNPTPSTVLIGGVVGPANIDIAKAEATTAFLETNGSGYLSNTLMLMQDETTARALMAKHDEGDAKKRWTQERNDGGKAVYTRTGRLTDLPVFGDETYTAVLDVKLPDPNGSTVTRKVQYVAYRIRNLVVFVVTQDANASVYARREEAKVARLTQ